MTEDKSHSELQTTDTPDTHDITKLVRDELDRRDTYLQFAQGQIEKDREYFKHHYKLAIGFLSFLVLVAGASQYSSVSQMRADIKSAVDSQRLEMKTAVDAELIRDKTEMASLRADVARTKNEAQEKVQTELENVRAEVQKKIDTEFRSENIKGLIATAVQDRTNKELTNVIHSEASIQVAKGIKEQGDTIQKAVEDQTKESVKALQPTISASIEKATKEQVNVSVEPIRIKLAEYGNYIKVGNAAALAHGDDRKSFGYLMQVAEGLQQPESSSEELRKLATATVLAIIKQVNSPIQTVYNISGTPDDLKKLMLSQNLFDRITALDSYPKNDPSILPTLIILIKDDPSITSLNKAVILFDSLTKQTFKFYQSNDLLNWWINNKHSYVTNLGTSEAPR